MDSGIERTGVRFKVGRELELFRNVKATGNGNYECVMVFTAFM